MIFQLLPLHFRVCIQRNRNFPPKYYQTLNWQENCCFIVGRVMPHNTIQMTGSLHQQTAWLWYDKLYCTRSLDCIVHWLFRVKSSMLKWWHDAETTQLALAASRVPAGKEGQRAFSWCELAGWDLSVMWYDQTNRWHPRNITSNVFSVLLYRVQRSPLYNNIIKSIL